MYAIIFCLYIIAIEFFLFLNFTLTEHFKVDFLRFSLKQIN